MSTKKMSLITVFVTVFIDLLGMGIVIPIAAPLLLDTSGGILPLLTPYATRTAILGLLVAVFPLAQFFGAPILGGLADRYGRRKILLIALCGTFLGYIIFAYGILTDNLWLLFFSRLLDGFTGGNLAIIQSAIADISDEKSKAKNFGLIGMAFGLGFVIGPYVGGKLADPTVISWFNYATPFWFAAILSIINIALVVWRFPETLRVRVRAPLSLLTGFYNIKKALTAPQLRLLFIVIFLLAFGFNFFAQFFQVYLFERFHYTQSQIGDLFAYIGLWIAVVQGVLTRPLSHRFRPDQIFSWSTLGLAITLFALLLPHESWWLYLIVPFVALTNGVGLPNYTALISNSVDEQSQGEILGISQSVQSLAQAIPPIIAGFITAVHMSLPILVGGILVTLAWLIWVICYKHSPQKKFQAEL